MIVFTFPFSIHNIGEFARIQHILKFNSTSFTLEYFFPSMNIGKFHAGNKEDYGLALLTFQSSNVF